MARQLEDWLSTYCEWTSITESPRVMHFWSGVCAVAGALRRRVWIDRLTFRWFPSFFVILVAKPGIVNKSTTADLSMGILRGVPGIKFGPDSITWQSLVTSFAESCESFQIGEDWHPMSAMTIASSELGLLLNMQDRDMVNLLITLWDGRDRLEKKTKMNGSDFVEAPWITLLGCTTPKAIAENMPRSAVGGGFTSRCIFVFRDEKQHLVHNPRKLVRPGDHDVIKKALIADLEHISITLVGEYQLTDAADKWEEQWYERMWTQDYPQADSEILQAYLSRKQTHLCKLAMVLSAARRDELVIHTEDLQLAEQMLLSVEGDLEKVFALIGKTEASAAQERVVEFVKRKKTTTLAEIFSLVSSQFPDERDFNGILGSLTKTGIISIIATGSGYTVKYTGAGA